MSCFQKNFFSYITTLLLLTHCIPHLSLQNELIIKCILQNCPQSLLYEAIIWLQKEEFCVGTRWIIFDPVQINEPFKQTDSFSELIHFSKPINFSESVCSDFESVHSSFLFVATLI